MDEDWRIVYMMKSTYSEGFKEQARKKVFQRDQRSIRAGRISAP